MAKGYWMAFYRSISDDSALAKYVAVAAPAIEARGGRFLARGLPAQTYEAGLKRRTALIEFNSVQEAIDAYESPEYQAALRILGGTAEREIRILEGL